MKVLKLSEFGEKKFISLLNQLIETSTDRNRHWFPPLLKNYKKYEEWFFVIDDSNDQFVGFSTIQKFYDRCFRVLTRCYVDPNYRRSVLPEDDQFLSPGSLMVQEQVAYLANKFDTVFISLEHIKRKRATLRMAQKMQNTTNLPWKCLEGMFQTCGNEKDYRCWQNICYSGDEPHLKMISYDSWQTLFDQSTLDL